MSALQMSMYYVFTNSFQLFDEAYECPEESAILKIKRPILGTVFLVTGGIFLTLYIPCLIAIIQKKFRAPVYQIMFALGVFDIISLFINSICTGTFDILGISFCHYPVLIFGIGALGVSTWMSGCLACVLLAIERCAEINPDFPLEFLFRTPVFPYVRILMVVFFGYTFLFMKSVVFSTGCSCWYFDPMLGKDPRLYYSLSNTINNYAVGLTTTALYVYISYRLIAKHGYSTSMWLYKTKRQILFQALTLCIFHTATAFIYELMQYTTVTPAIVIVSQFLWQWSNGAVCLAYLIFNRTIRNMVLKLVLSKGIRLKYGWHVGVDEHIALEKANAAVIAGVGVPGVVVKVDNFMN